MSKLDIGVGEEFPVDEEKVREEAPGEDADPCRCGPGSHFGGTRAERREAMRRWRHQMRSEWRARRRAVHEQFHREFAGEMHAHDARHVVGRLAVAGLALIGLAALFHYHHDQ